MRISLRKNKIWIIILVILILLVLNFYHGGIKNLFYSFSAPIQKLLWGKGQEASGFFGAIFNAKSLRDRVEGFRSENQKLLAEIALLEELKRENKALREALDIDLQKEFKLVLAEIISKDINEDSILINKGSEEGIKEDMPVITESRVLLGKICDVSRNFSKVMLISSRKSSLDARVQEKEIQGIVEGKGNLSLSLRLLPQDKETQEGDLIVSTSLGGIFPKGLLLGKIEKIKIDDVKPVQEAIISPFFDLTQLDTVFIISGF